MQIIIYLLILIIWKSSNTIKEHANYGTWVIDSNGIKHIDYYKWNSGSKWIWIKSLHTNKKVVLPENHILMKILHQNLEYTKFMKAIQYHGNMYCPMYLPNIQAQFALL